MRLMDIVTVDVLERAIHWPLPDDPAAAREVEASMKADQDERFRSTLPLAEVFGKCLLQCGDMVDGTSKAHQLELIHKMLMCVDGAIDIATRDIH